MTTVSSQGGMRAEGKRDAHEVGLRPWALGTNGGTKDIEKGAEPPSVMQMCLKLGEQTDPGDECLPRRALPSPTALYELTILTPLEAALLGPSHRRKWKALDEQSPPLGRSLRIHEGWYEYR